MPAERIKVFVSYSREDAQWLDRLRQHVSVLERRGLVDVWSDARIGAGSDWEAEIDAALSAAKVAVLLVTPAFMASEYIWVKEMPRILAHSAQGMAVVPLLVRPCAWRLAEELERLQARPSDGLALSLGTESKVDLDLSAFAYELAAKIGAFAAGPSGVEPASDASRSRGSAGFLMGEWAGFYNRTRPLHMTIGVVENGRFRGSLTYMDEDTRTSVEGEIYEQWPSGDAIWAQIEGSGSGPDRAGVRFRETGYLSQGTRAIDFGGEYCAVVARHSMRGAWFSGTRLVGVLALDRESGM